MAKAKEPAKKATNVVANRVVGLTLADVSIHFRPQDDEKEPSAEFDYTVEIDTPSIVEDVIFFGCTLKVRKQYKDEEEDVASIGANYFCGVSGALKKDSENETLAKKYAQTSIWGAFSSLFAICAQQMGISFPPLPPAPGRIEVVNIDSDEG